METPTTTVVCYGLSNACIASRIPDRDTLRDAAMACLELAASSTCPVDAERWRASAGALYDFVQVARDVDRLVRSVPDAPPVRVEIPRELFRSVYRGSDMA